MTCDHFKCRPLCRCDALQRMSDNCGEMSVIQQNICLFRPKPTWSDDTSLSLLIREFICFLFTHRLIAAVASNSCETSSAPPTPPFPSPIARLLRQTPSVCFPAKVHSSDSSAAVRSSTKATFSLPVTFPIFLSHILSFTQIPPPPPTTTTFLWVSLLFPLPQYPTWPASYLSRLMSTRHLLRCLGQVSFVLLFCAWQHTPTPTAHHQTWVHNVGR